MFHIDIQIMIKLKTYNQNTSLVEVNQERMVSCFRHGAYCRLYER